MSTEAEDADFVTNYIWTHAFSWTDLAILVAVPTFYFGFDFNSLISITEWTLFDIVILLGPLSGEIIQILALISAGIVAYIDLGSLTELILTIVVLIVFSLTQILTNFLNFVVGPIVLVALVLALVFYPLAIFLPGVVVITYFVMMGFFAFGITLDDIIELLNTSLTSVSDFIKAQGTDNWFWIGVIIAGLWDLIWGVVTWANIVIKAFEATNSIMDENDMYYLIASHMIIPCLIPIILSFATSAMLSFLSFDTGQQSLKFSLLTVGVTIVLQLVFLVLFGLGAGSGALVSSGFFN